MGLKLITVPIGNTDDITIRALRELTDIKVIYSEDTRKLKELLRRLNIDYRDKEIDSFHDHSSQEKLEKIITKAQSGNVALVSDAGSPVISDPAYPLIRLAIEARVKIFSCGGVSSLIYALELSGLPTVPFTFHGFLGRKPKDRKKFIELLKSNQGTHIIFEGVSRVEKLLEELCSELTHMKFVVARELTKSYESLYRFKGSDFPSIREDITYKGEFVILISHEKSDKEDSGIQMLADEKVRELAQDVIHARGKGKALAKLLAYCTGEKAKKIYMDLQS